MAPFKIYGIIFEQRSVDYTSKRFEIFSNPIPDELLNKTSELLSKCRHESKLLLAIIKRMIDIRLIDRTIS